jgi:hypothetical protein
MLNSLWNAVMGTANSNHGYNAQGPAQSQYGYVQQNQSIYNNPSQYQNQNHAAWMAQQAQRQAYTQAVPPKWMINGKIMSITEFADELFGDTPQRTLFLLKYSDKK